MGVENLNNQNPYSLRLIINLGSASKKIAAYSDGQCILRSHFEYIKSQSDIRYILTLQNSNIEEKDKDITEDDYKNAAQYIYKILQKEIFTLDTDNSHNLIIAIRVVAPGTYFTRSKVIDATYIEQLENISQFDPVHILPILDQIKILQRDLPKSLLFAISDSEVYADSKYFKREYALDKGTAEKYDLYRFGYHGISIQYIMEELKKEFIENNKLFLNENKSNNLSCNLNYEFNYDNIIICHLGSGASVTSLRDMQPVCNSMEYSPCEGLISSTRVGDMGSGAILKMINDGLSSEEVLDILYKNGGLNAVSKITGDMKVLIEEYKNNNESAIKAIDMFVEYIVGYIGKYAATLGGLDIIVFSGTIGYRSEFIRDKILKRLNFLNIKQIKVIETDEQESMNKVLDRLL